MTANEEPRILADFLDERDAACPSCGYNLCAVSRPVCPECGETLALTLRHPNPLWGRRGLLALLFCWLVLAGSMNAAREGRTIHASLTMPVQTVGRLQLLTQPPAIQVPPPRIPGRLTGVMLGNPEIIVPDADGNDVSMDARELFYRQQLVLAQPNVTVTPLAASPGLNWSSVAWPQWVRGGAWSALALVAATALVMLFRCRSRAASPRVVRALTILAWASFGSYFAYHGWSFVMEMI